MSKWKQPPSRMSISNNALLEGDGFYISYATALGLRTIAMFASDDNSDETALVIEGKFYILNGDYRKDYEKLVDQGPEKCLAFYHQHDNQSSWSEQEPDQ